MRSSICSLQIGRTRCVSSRGNLGAQAIQLRHDVDLSTALHPSLGEEFESGLMKNKLKEKLSSGQPAIGSWIALSGPYSIEVMADIGFDWLLIDMEHIPIGREGLKTIMMACKGSDSTVIVRLDSGSRSNIQTALDLGAHGGMVP